jgi:hypothetical protein
MSTDSSRKLINGDTINNNKKNGIVDTMKQNLDDISAKIFDNLEENWEIH